jgi:preflagellin peptidase FlaK
MGTTLDIIRLIVGVSVLSYASYTDIKTRRASNINWLIMGGIGGILLVVQYFTVGFENYLYLLFIPIMIGLVYTFFQMRLIFGGADAKALMAIAILTPLEPSINQFPLWSGSFMPFSWTIFSNSIIIFLFIPISLLIINIAKRDIQFPFVFLGYKMDIKTARNKFVWPLERLVEGKRKFVYMPNSFEVDGDYNILEKNGISRVWVTPKIPFMIPLFVGFIAAFIIGDILFFLINLI